MRSIRILLAVAFAASVTAGCSEEVRDALSPEPTGCYIGGGSEPLQLTSEQTFHAATIAAVGHRDGMNERAVAAAIATSFQESGLANIDYGDRDSLGLFQQRPSAGWGSEEEILDPVYASFKFYEKLRRIDGWEEMAIGDAAQAVQVSAHPDLYHQWEDEAFAVAAALAGGEEAGVRCMVAEERERSVDTASLTEAYEYEWGTEVSAVEGQVVTIEAADEAEGWNRASWAVAKSRDWDIASVEHAGQVWESGEDTWAAVEDDTVEAAATEGSTVVIVVAGGE